MEQLLTTNVATNLYWFGRHLQRVESTLIDVIELFDIIIDGDRTIGRDYYERLEIELPYDNASEFLENAIFGEHAGNLANLMSYARENAIIARAHIDADAFGETMKLAELFDHASKSATLVDYRFVDEALSLINEIWGSISRGLVRYTSDHFVRLGNLSEKVDLHVRHGKNSSELSEYLNNILITAKKIAPEEAKLAIYETDEETNLDAINDLINQLVVE
jgi:uncharacterized alpha-E superfamily protein